MQTEASDNSIPQNSQFAVAQDSYTVPEQFDDHDN